MGLADDRRPENAPDMTDALAALRTEYAGRPLLETAMAELSPEAAVRQWLDEAVKAEIMDPNAMTLATVDADGQPDARVVLLKGIEDSRYVFYTNYQSTKGTQLEVERRGCLVFFWAPLFRQIRIRGAISRVSPEVSKAYFQSRPRGSQLGAWASAQSEVIEGRELLEARYRALEGAYPEGTEIPLPEFWGGYALTPHETELWQGRPSRLHDRLLARAGRPGWVRLSP